MNHVILTDDDPFWLRDRHDEPESPHEFLSEVANAEFWDIADRPEVSAEITTQPA